MGEELRSMERKGFAPRGNRWASPPEESLARDTCASGGQILGFNTLFELREGSLEYTDCKRKDGTIYSISEGKKCRKGEETVRPDPEKVARVKHALECSFEEFLNTYGKTRERKFEASANEAAEKFLSIRGAEDIDNKDAFMHWKAVDELISLTPKISALGNAKGEDAANRLIGTHRVFGTLKWGLLNPQNGITPGTLRLVWAGMKPTAKPEDAFPGMKKKFGTYRVVVEEHVVPTAMMPTLMMRGIIKGEKDKDLLQSFLKRNIMSLTSAPEANKLDDKGYGKVLPEVNNVFSRYDNSKIKLLPSTITDGYDSRAVSALGKSATEAKKAGWTFDEWAASVIDI